MFSTASPATEDDAGNAKLHRYPFSLPEFLKNDSDPPSNYNQLVFVHGVEDSSVSALGSRKSRNETRDAHTPFILHTTFNKVAAGAASYAGRHVEIMLFNTYVRMGKPISISVVPAGDQGQNSAQTLMEADDKQGMLNFDRNTLPKHRSRLDIVVLRGTDGEERLGKIVFDLDRLPKGSEPHLVVTGSASWQTDSGVLLTIQIVDIPSGIRVFDTYVLT